MDQFECLSFDPVLLNGLIHRVHDHVRFSCRANQNIYILICNKNEQMDAMEFISLELLSHSFGLLIHFYLSYFHSIIECYLNISIIGAE